MAIKYRIKYFDLLNLKKRIMKNILYLSIIGCLLFTSCGDDWLSKAQPSTSTDTSEAITSERDALYALNGTYDLLREYEYYGARMTFYGDVTGEDMQANGETKRAAKYYLFDFTKDNTPSSLWYQPYRVIRRANNILAYIKTLSDTEMTDGLKDIKGQALTLRAMGHFDLAKVFGSPYTKDNGASLAAPIELVPHEYNSRPKRSTVAQVYERVIKDLEDAELLLSAAPNNGRFNKFGAQQLLARAYLYTGKDAEAYTTITTMIADAETPATATKAQYKLWTNAEYSTIWTKDFTSEMLLQLPVTKTETGPGKEGIGYLMWRSGYDDIILSYDYMDMIKTDANDVRLKLTTKYTNSKGAILYYLNKYPGNTSEGENPQYANIPVLRFSEAYLIAAEAAVKLNDNVNAITYLKAIVSRANPAMTVTGIVTLDDVLNERRKELVGEGHRLFDAMRNDKRIERQGASHNLPSLRPETKSFDRTFYKTVMSIPRQEIDANPNMVQNPGY